MLDVPTTNKLISYLSERRGMAAAYLFGSQAKGRVSGSSDIDLAVLFENGQVPDFREQMVMREDLASLAGRDVDLVILNHANPILKQQVFKSSSPILICNSTLARNFRVRTTLEYDDLKRVRAPVERALAQRMSHGR